MNLENCEKAVLDICIRENLRMNMLSSLVDESPRESDTHTGSEH